MRWGLNVSAVSTETAKSQRVRKDFARPKGLCRDLCDFWRGFAALPVIPINDVVFLDESQTIVIADFVAHDDKDQRATTPGLLVYIRNAGNPINVVANPTEHTMEKYKMAPANIRHGNGTGGKSAAFYMAVRT